MKNVDLEARWAKTVEKCGKMRNLRLEDFNMIKDIYSSPDRFYHNLNHLKYCFWVFDRTFPLTKYKAALDLSIWFHDIFYDMLKHETNEIVSADYAKKYIKGRAGENDFGLSDLVGEFILSTKHDAPPKNHMCEMIMDVDMVILAADHETFNEYEKNIRKEYMVHRLESASTNDYNTGRLKFLNGLLSKKCIFYTKELKSLDPLARENISRSILNLAS